MAKEVTTLSLKAGNGDAERKIKNFPIGWKCQEFGKTLLHSARLHQETSIRRLQGEWLVESGKLELLSRA